MDNVAADWIKNAALFLAAVAATVYYVKVIFWGDKPSQTQIAPQPLAVKIIEEIHERFAGKQEFQEHVKENSARHKQLFDRIELVGEKARQELEERIEEIQMDRRRTMEKLNDTFTEIRVDLGAIKTELKIRNE